MGSKIAARKAMRRPNCSQLFLEVMATWQLQKMQLHVPRTLGYPVMLKATFGGGGRGIRLCHDENQIRQQFDRVQSEAQKSFGDSHVYMERFIVNPRHIEVQILGDRFGNMIHLLSGIVPYNVVIKNWLK